MNGIDSYIGTVTVEPRYGIRAVQFPAGGSEQSRVSDMLKPLGITARLYDGVVEQFDKPLPNGNNWQWRSISIDGVYKSAAVGDWIVVHLGRHGKLHIETMTDETFQTTYKEVKP